MGLRHLLVVPSYVKIFSVSFMITLTMVIMEWKITRKIVPTIGLVKKREYKSVGVMVIIVNCVSRSNQISFLLSGWKVICLILAPKHVFEMVAVDHLGPFRKTASGNQHVSVIFWPRQNILRLTD